MFDDLFFSMIYAFLLGLSLFSIFICLARIFLLGKHFRFDSILTLHILNSSVVVLPFFSIQIEVSLNSFQSKRQTTEANCSSKIYVVVLSSLIFIQSNVLQSIFHLDSVLPVDKKFFSRRRSHLLAILLIWLFALAFSTFPFAFDVFVSDAKLRFCPILTSSIIFDVFFVVFILICPSIIVVSNYVYVQRRFSTINSPILRLMGTDLTMRILTKRFRKELKNSFGLVVQMSIFVIGYFPTTILMFVDRQIVFTEIFLFSNFVLTLSMTILLVFSSLTNRSIRKILIPKRRTSTIVD